MKHLISALCLIGALAAYVAGWGEGIAALVVLGVVLEATFWIRIVQGRRARRMQGIRTRTT